MTFKDKDMIERTIVRLEALLDDEDLNESDRYHIEQAIENLKGVDGKNPV